MMDHERALLARGWDLHMYDIAGIGNPLLREWIAQDQADTWGLPVTSEHILLATGSLDALDKCLRGLRVTSWAGPAGSVALLFPTPASPYLSGRRAPGASTSCVCPHGRSFTTS
jgi:hypothetical protein